MLDMDSEDPPLTCSCCFCTRCCCGTALGLTALSGLWPVGGVAAVAPGYYLLSLVTLHFPNLDAPPTGLTALRGHCSAYYW